MRLCLDSFCGIQDENYQVIGMKTLAKIEELVIDLVIAGALT